MYNTDFRCGDHINVYPFIVKALKHLGSHARIAEHTGANNGKLGDIALRVKLLEAKALLALLQSGNCIIQIILIYGKRNVLCSCTSDRLQDNIYINVFLCKNVK